MKLHDNYISLCAIFISLLTLTIVLAVTTHKPVKRLTLQSKQMLCHDEDKDTSLCNERNDYCEIKHSGAKIISVVCWSEI